MLTQKEIQAAVQDRLDAMGESCNAGHLDHNAGVLRGLLWALIETDPGCHLDEDTERVLTLAGIPNRRIGNKVYYFDNMQQYEETINMTQDQLDEWVKNFI